MEQYNATCHHNEVILMRSARYGRMNTGKCLTTGYGHLGCAADVRAIMDARCSGRRSCSFIVPPTEMYQTQPCNEEFTSYLEAAYDCLPGENLLKCVRVNISCPLVVVLTSSNLFWLKFLN